MTTNFVSLLTDSTTVTGTGNATTSGTAATGYKLLVAIGPVGTKFDYRIGAPGAAEWEEGEGKVLSATSFSRSPLDSSNGGALVNFSAGTKAVAHCLIASRMRKLHQRTSSRVVCASAYLDSDTDLTFDSDTSGVDQVAQAQAMLDIASDGKPLTILWDVAGTFGASSTTTSLRIRGKTKIATLPGCGGKMAPNSCVPMWRNYNPSILPTSIIDKDIEIYGGTWHGNSANQSLRETDANGGMSTFDFVGVDGLAMSGHHRIVRAKSFAWRATNCYNIDIVDGTIDFGKNNSAVNTDGYHLNGPCQYVSIQNVKLFYCADDALAFNADDGWNAPGIKPGPYVSSGDILDVKIRGVYLNGYSCGIRLLSGGSRIDRFSVDDISGRTGGYWLIADNFVPAYTATTGVGNIGTLLIGRVNMENVIQGAWPQIGAHLNCKIGKVVLTSVTKTKFLNSDYPAFRVGEKGNIKQLTFAGYESYPDNGGTYTTRQIVVASGGYVGTMRVNDCVFDGGNGGSPIVVEAGGTVDRLIGMGNSGTGFTSFVSNQGTINSLHFPDASNFMDGASVGSTWALDPGYTETSASGVTFSAAEPGVEVARKTAVDTFAGNIQLSSTIRFTGTVSGSGLNAALLVRGLNLQPYSGSSRSAYVMDINKISGQVTLQRSDSGDTVIGSRVTVSGGIALESDYKATLTAKGSVIFCSLQRVSDSLYLQPNGAWAATAANCCSGTDATYGSGSGLQYGVYGYNQNTSSASIVYTNFTAIAAP